MSHCKFVVVTPGPQETSHVGGGREPVKGLGDAG